MHHKLKTKLFSCILIFSIFLSIPTSAKAYVAWPDIGGAFFEVMLTEVMIQVRAAAMGALKKAAIDTVSETVNNIVSGGTQAGALFITDWEDYLFGTPQGNTASYMNDFFTITTRGRSSGSYLGACGNNYSEWRTARAKSMNVELDLTELQDNFQEYACEAKDMFADGSWAAYQAFMEPNNNPIMYTLIAEDMRAQKELKEQEKARAQAEAYNGFIAQKNDNGIVLTPGSLIEGLTTAANTMDNDAVANARNVGEVAGIVVGKIASSVIKQGIGNARANLQNKINDNICNASQGIRDQLKNFTPSGHLLNGSGLGTIGDSSSNACVIN